MLVNYKKQLLILLTFTQLPKMALTKMNKAIIDMVKEVEISTINKVKTLVIQNLSEEYEADFVEAVEKIFNDMKIDSYADNIKKSSGRKSPDGEKKKREPTAYNLFLKAKMAEIKEAGTELKGKDLMKAAIVEWNKEKAAKSDDHKSQPETEAETEDESEPEAPAAKGKAEKGKGGKGLNKGKK